MGFENKVYFGQHGVILWYKRWFVNFYVVGVYVIIVAKNMFFWYNIPFMITNLGKNKLETQLRELEAKLEYTIAERRKAAEEGDLRENSAYHFLGEQAVLIKTQIEEITLTLQKSKIIKNPTQNATVELGHRVTVKFEDGRQMDVVLVGKFDSAIKPGWISFESPLAQALLGKKVGNTLLVNEQKVEILAIETENLE